LEPFRELNYGDELRNPGAKHTSIKITRPSRSPGEVEEFVEEEYNAKWQGELRLERDLPDGRAGDMGRNQNNYDSPNVIKS